MRILVISDTHKKHKNLAQVVEKIGKIDLCIHLGDGEGYEDYIEEMVNCPLKIVAGNGDKDSNLERELQIELGIHKLLLTHGNRYLGLPGTAALVREGEKAGADIVMFGHTHKPMIQVEKGITLVNPGSISLPRQEDRRPSYILLEIDQTGRAHFTLNFLNNYKI